MDALAADVATRPWARAPATRAPNGLQRMRSTRSHRFHCAWEVPSEGLGEGLAPVPKPARVYLPWASLGPPIVPPQRTVGTGRKALSQIYCVPFLTCKPPAYCLVIATGNHASSIECWEGAAGLDPVAGGTRTTSGASHSTATCGPGQSPAPAQQSHLLPPTSQAQAPPPVPGGPVAGGVLRQGSLHRLARGELTGHARFPCIVERPKRTNCAPRAAAVLLGGC